MVLLSFPAACRDPEMFPDADKVIIDRKENRHAAFGLGIHRCVGSNLARMEMTVAVEELLKRIPEFSLDGEVTWSEGTVRGPRKLPIKIQLRADMQQRARPPVERLGNRLGPPRPALDRRPVPDLGRVAPDVPDRPHRALPRRLPADALRRRARRRLRPGPFLLAPDCDPARRIPRAAAARRRSRPIRRSTALRAWCCCRRSRPRRSRR